MKPSSPLQNCKIQHKSSFSSSSSSSSLSASSCLDQRSPVQMDTAGWPHQKIGLVKPVEDMPPASFSTTTNSASNNCTAAVSRSQVTERRVRPQKDQQALNCPRCNSTNTKFCYYNNYSLTQPRYFCKACRRYWTAGGSLRNVPVGGGSRKNKRSSLVPSSSGTAATASIKKPTTTISPKIYDQGQHLNQAFQHSGLPGINDFAISINGAIDRSNACPPVGAFSAMELLRNGMISTSRSFGPLVSMPMPYTSAFGLQELRPPVTLSFQGLQESGDGRMLFPFNESAPPVVPSSASGDHFAQGSRGGGGEPPGFWINGMIEY